MAASRLRITQVVTNDNFAGTERYVTEVTNELARRGHDLVVVGGKGDSMTELLEPGVTWSAGGTAPDAVRALIRGGRRDIMHGHVAKSDFVVAAAAPFTGGARISTRHITAIRGYTSLARKLAQPVRRMLTCEIAVSRWTSDQLEAPADLVLLNGVRVEPDVDAPRTPTILVAQRLAPEKDTATAVRAFARSGLAAEGWRLVIAGSGDELPALQGLAVELGVRASIEFAGWVQDPTEWYRSSGMFLAPAPGEPCGLSILEAMAHGLPVVAASSGGHLETVGTVTSAALFDAGDDAAAARHLVRLAREPVGRAAYGAELRTLQRKCFTIDRHVDRLEQIYRDALPRRRRARRHS